MDKKIVILCDFDGTVAQNDVGDLLFKKFSGNGKAEAVIERWRRGEISSRECLECEAEMARVEKSDLDRFLSGQRLDPYFKDFNDFAKKRNMEVVIMSDGLDYYIESMLVKNGLGDIDFYANQLQFAGDTLQVEFPHYDLLGCEDCACCKTHHLYSYRDRGYFVIYVGDGLSDCCPSTTADLVFAKGQLADFCRKSGVDYIEFRNFRDVEREVLKRIFLGEGLADMPG
jgi:2,3-diketo-5-methylthio-1-phosphopentane phosphatase